MSIQSVAERNLRIDEHNAKIGNFGQALLASGSQIAMRLWDEQPGDAKQKQPVARPYETVGYVLSGRAEVIINGEPLALEAGSSWIVPQNTEHSYRILEHFRAVEATHPPARNQ